MGLDRGTLAKIDRRVFAELDHAGGVQAVKVPVSDAVWSTWRRYCEAIGLSMGEGVAALIFTELKSVIGAHNASSPGLVEQVARQAEERAAELEAREHKLERLSQQLRENEEHLRAWERRLNTQSVAGSQIRRSAKIGRNEPCPCGSGLKYKRCHGTWSPEKRYLSGRNRSGGVEKVSVIPGVTARTSVRSRLASCLMARELIHPRTRREFREYCVGWGVLRTIESAFEVEGFESGPTVDAGGARRSLFETYASVIDWGDAEQVSRAIHVFEEMLSWTWGDSHGTKAVVTLKRCLRRDGYEVDDEGRIRPILTRPIRDLPLESLRDPSAIEEHLVRLDATGEADPALAISSSKALVEATCKHVLEELAQPYDDRAG